MPAYFVGHVTTFWRIFARFGVLVTFGCAMLAALTLTVAARRLRRGHLVDRRLRPDRTRVHGRLPACLSALAASGLGGLAPRPTDRDVANYPMPTDKPQALSLLLSSYYQQTYTHQPQFALFGSGYGDTREDAIRILARYVTDPLTPGILKAEDVRYVLLHDDVYRAQGEAPPPIPAGFHLVASLPGDVRAIALDRGVQADDLASVLDQNASQIALVEGLPAPALAMPDTAEGPDGARVLRGNISFNLTWNDSRLTRAQVLIHASSPSPTTLQLVSADGSVIGQSAIGAADTLVLFGPIPLAGTSARLQLRTTPSSTAKLSSIQIQPLADVTTSVRDVR